MGDTGPWSLPGCLGLVVDGPESDGDDEFRSGRSRGVLSVEPGAYPTSVNNRQEYVKRLEPPEKTKF